MLHVSYQIQPSMILIFCHFWNTRLHSSLQSLSIKKIVQSQKLYTYLGFSFLLSFLIGVSVLIGDLFCSFRFLKRSHFLLCSSILLALGSTCPAKRYNYKKNKDSFCRFHLSKVGKLPF